MVQYDPIICVKNDIFLGRLCLCPPSLLVLTLVLFTYHIYCCYFGIVWLSHLVLFLLTLLLLLSLLLLLFESPSVAYGLHCFCIYRGSIMFCLLEYMYYNHCENLPAACFSSSKYICTFTVKDGFNCFCTTNRSILLCPFIYVSSNNLDRQLFLICCCW